MTEPNHLFPFPSDKLRLENLPDRVKLHLPEKTVLLSADEALGVASALVEAASVAGGNSVEELDWRRIPVQFLHFTAERSSEDDSETEDEFASVRCWIGGQTRANAVYVATGWIMDNGWTITNLIEQRKVTRADHAGAEDERYYEQVLTDGEVFVFEIDGADEDGGDSGQ
ncbi:MAG: hypothetical protein ACRELG_04730 [Gemmataceae bacterium]